MIFVCWDAHGVIGLATFPVQSVEKEALTDIRLAFVVIYIYIYMCVCVCGVCVW